MIGGHSGCPDATNSLGNLFLESRGAKKAAKNKIAAANNSQIVFLLIVFLFNFYLGSIISQKREIFPTFDAGQLKLSCVTDKKY
jgi:hypothetical protein